MGRKQSSNLLALRDINTLHITTHCQPRIKNNATFSKIFPQPKLNGQICLRVNVDVQWAKIVKLQVVPRFVGFYWE